MSALLWAAVVLIGGAGSVVRFLADGVMTASAARDFPLGTLAVNVSGAVILGLITGLALGQDEALLAGTAAVGSTQRGIWGFHGDHAPHGDRLLQLGRHVPAVTVVIDTPERIATAFSVIDELTSERGLVTCETIPALRTGAGLDRDGPRIAALR